MIQELNTEQKQRINLTLHAQEVLLNDHEQFAPHLTNSGFINELLYRFAPQADASITEMTERQRQTILQHLEKQQLQAEQLEAVAEALVEPRRKELIRKALGYAKGTSIIFRLTPPEGADPEGPGIRERDFHHFPVE